METEPKSLQSKHETELGLEAGCQRLQAQGSAKGEQPTVDPDLGRENQVCYAAQHPTNNEQNNDGRNMPSPFCTKGDHGLCK